MSSAMLRDMLRGCVSREGRGVNDLVEGFGGRGHATYFSTLTPMVSLSK